jgi:ATP-binding cassette, subfamily B, bacterial MsbA
MPSKSGTYRTLFVLLKRTGVKRGQVVATLGLMLLAGALEGSTFGLLLPLLSTLTGSSTGNDLVSRYFPQTAAFGPAARVVLLCAGTLGLFVLKNVVGYLAVRGAASIRQRALEELRRQLLDRVLYAEPAFLEKTTTGEISGIFLVEAGRANRALEYALSLTQRALIACGYAAAILVISLRLTVLTVMLGIALGAVTEFISRRSLKHGRDLASASTQLGREVSETVGGLRVVRATAAQEERAQTFNLANAEHARADVAMSFTTHRSVAANEVLGIAGAMALTAAAHILWISTGELPVSHFLAFGFGLVRLLPSLNQVYNMHAAVAGFTGSVECVLRWLNLSQYPVRPFGKKTLTSITRGLSFEDVSFGYSGGRKALDRVSFEIKAGEMTAIVGSSGSGKTTLVSLLLRLREASSGTIRIDGIDHWEFEPKSFHRAIAFVEQDPFMFNRSIAENVLYGAPWLGRADAERALRQVQLWDSVTNLPDGIDTILGERGATLSGGQRQRLAIARAIVRDPALLILDEPSSALDPVTEREVMAAIEAVSAGRTTLIITHRPTTVAGARRVIRLGDGKLEAVDVVPEPLRVNGAAG